MGHTLKGFGTLKSLPIWLSLVQVGDCWWYAQEAIITIRIRVLIGLQHGSLLSCSINMRGGARGDIHLQATTWNPSRHLLSIELLQSPSCASGASTPMRSIPSLYVWTSWIRCCGCCCADRLWWSWRLLSRRARGGDDRERLLPLHWHTTTLDSYSNSSFATQRV
jgi:hypothetical protein